MKKAEVAVAIVKYAALKIKQAGGKTIEVVVQLVVKGKNIISWKALKDGTKLIAKEVGISYAVELIQEVLGRIRNHVFAALGTSGYEPEYLWEHPGF